MAGKEDQPCTKPSRDIREGTQMSQLTATRRGSTSAGGPQPHGSLGTEVRALMHKHCTDSDTWLQPPSKEMTMRSLAFIEPGYGKCFRCTNAFNLHPMTFIPTSLHQEVKQGTHSPTASRPRLEFSPGLRLQSLSSAHCPSPTTQDSPRRQPAGLGDRQLCPCRGKRGQHSRRRKPARWNPAMATGTLRPCQPLSLMPLIGGHLALS